MRRFIAPAIGLALLLGCGDKPPEKTVFDPQVEALKRAREVERKVQDAAQQQRELIERETERESK